MMRNIFLKLKDQVWTGMCIGLLLPCIAFGIVTYIKKTFPFLAHDDLLYIGCVAINLPLVFQAFNVRKEILARGIVGATFICALIFVYYKLFFK